MAFVQVSVSERHTLSALNYGTIRSRNSEGQRAATSFASSILVIRSNRLIRPWRAPGQASAILSKASAIAATFAARLS